ncbi:hypothetical protein BCR44DRAFT_1279342, partial [Catenaria anguillulae PL171]
MNFQHGIFTSPLWFSLSLSPNENCIYKEIGTIQWTRDINPSNMFSTTAVSSPSSQAAAVVTLAGAAAATTTAMTTSRHNLPAWLLAPWTSLLAPLLRLLSTWLRTRLLALLPAPLHFVLGRTSRSLDSLLAALALVLSAALAHQRLVPLIAQRILDTATLTLGALDMAVNGPTSVLTSITSILKIPGPPLATRMVADREPMRIVYRGRVVTYATLKGTVHVPAGGGVVPMEAVMSVSNGKSKVDSLEQGFSEFCRDLVQATGQVKFAMVGDQVEIRVLGGRIGVPGLKLNKSVSLPGMGGLGDMSIDSVLLVDSTLSSLILECTCSIVNPSSVSMTAGTVAFGMTTPDLYESAMSSSLPTQDALESVTLASISIPSMRLVPGRNTLTAICTMRRPHPATQPNSTLVTAGLRILSRYLTGQPSDVVVFGVSAGDTARYLTPAIQSVVTHTVLPPLLDPTRGIPPQLLVQTSLAVSQVSL